MDAEVTLIGLSELRAAVDTLLTADPSTLRGTALAAVIRELETQRRRLEAVDQRMLAEVAEQGLAGEYARYSPADLLVTLLRVTPTEAKARVARARDLAQRRTMTGEPLPPILPATASAVAAGEISPAHVRVITNCMDELPPAVDPTVADVAESLLVDAARHEHPGQLAKTAALLIARLDPDGLEPTAAKLERMRGFGLLKRRDGSSEPTGLLTPEATALWETVLDALGAPVPSTDGLPDDRSPAQRRHDALADAATRLLRSGSLPAAGGVPVTVLARTSTRELQSGSGTATTSRGQLMSIDALLRMAADANIVPVLCDHTGGVLAYGRTRRLASAGQRAALAARDGGCCFPGCDRPAAWCEVHHIRAWINGGATDLDNMCLLCRFHHREFERRGWQALMIDDIPHWIPPAWLDHEQLPVRNTAHHITDFDFDVGAA